MGTDEEVAIEDVEGIEDAESSVESLFGSLCEYMQIDPQRNPDTFIATSIGAMEYACVIARQCGVNKAAYMEAVTNVWGRIHEDEEERSVRGKDEEGLDSDSSES